MSYDRCAQDGSVCRFVRQGLGTCTGPSGPTIVDGSTYQDFLNERPAYFFGDGAEKCKVGITHPNARFLPEVLPLARNMGPLAEKAFALADLKMWLISSLSI